jgi:uncharacterized protein (TIGR03437 family)
VARAPAVLTTATARVVGSRPNFTSQGVTNAASFLPGPAGGAVGICPGSLVALFGTNLAAQTATAQSLPLPYVLGGTVVRINGVAVPLQYVSPLQINFQVPFELTGSSAALEIENSVGVSAPLSIDVRGIHPGVFFDTATGAGAVLNADNTLVSEIPARRGEAVQIFATGLGPVEPSGRSGVAASSVPLSLTLSAPRVMIDGLEAEVTFSGLAPFLAGVYQVNAIVPAGLAPGQHRLRIEIAGVASNEVLIEVQ